ncbi:dynamin family protein [Yoonia maritima]|uniref:Dynamin family protein n=1 Tax=Yoonia maritima TaxID=1435347 RepID=A0A2T0VV00_9RHOB|nr:dynamin family protein [Yoonia maritima]PRY75292.1 dynamin family protein [Yoonia maritima]
MSDHSPTTGGKRKPRIALMGEFSAGKSTLSNLLMGARPLPEKVTATRLSPVWMSHGTDAPYRVDVDGTTEPVSLDQLEGIPVEQTMCIRLFLECDILDVCDLIDFPGISDPNMSSEVWERMLPEVDAVIWLTHATQAWRQSEAAVWDTMPTAVRENSVLLITRFDKLTTEKDRVRVFKRVLRETKGQFAATFPISLLQALEAGDDYERWDASGAGPFVEHLIQSVETLSKLAARTELPLYNIADGTAIPEPITTAVLPRRVKRPLNENAPKRERPAAEPSSKPGTPTS